MSPITLELLISALTVIVSICSSMFVAGSRWGRIEADMRNMSDRLAKIEGMFSLRLRESEQSRP